MALTLNDLHEKLKHIDEISLLEILEISSEDIVDKFKEKIEEKYEYLVTEFEEETFNSDLETDEEWIWEFEQWKEIDAE